MKLFTVFVLLTLLLSCGNHEKATGGKRDVENPEIVSVLPAEFSNIASTEQLEFTFSKPMDKNSIFTGIYIYPPILNKTYNWEKNTLFIEINEDLEEKSNYYFSFSDAIRGERRNPLNRDYLFIFTTDNVYNATISGEIEYELTEDFGKEVTFNVAAADSTFMFRTKAKGNYYKIENLEPEKHVILAYLDKNDNKRYDIGKEPQHRFISKAQSISVIPISLTYTDTVKPKLNRVKAISQKQITATFSKEISKIDNIQIQPDSLEIQVLSQVIKENTAFLITSPLDSLSYSLVFKGVMDYKDNIADSLSKEFTATTEKDSLPPEILYTNPRDGDSIYDKSPSIEIEFTKLVPADRVEAYLFANESQTKIDLILQETNQKLFVYKPEIQLSNFTTYKLYIRAENWFGVPYDNEGDINFIVVIHDS